MTTKSEYYKEWASANWDKRKEYMRQRVHCDVCNVDISRGSRFLHEKSKKHSRNIK